MKVLGTAVYRRHTFIVFVFIPSDDAHARFIVYNASNSALERPAVRYCANSWRLGLCAVLVMCLGTLSAAQSVSPLASQREILNRYCVTCHTKALKERGTVPIALDTLDI